MKWELNSMLKLKVQDVPGCRFTKQELETWPDKFFIAIFKLFVIPEQLQMSAYNQIVVDKHKYKNNKYFKKGEVCDISLNQMSGKFIQTVNRKTLI